MSRVVRCPGAGAPRAPPGASRAPPGAPRVSTGVPRAPAGAPRVPPGAPRAPPGVPRAPPGAPRAPPGAPRAPPGVPRAPPAAPRAQPGLPRAQLAPPRAPARSLSRPARPQSGASGTQGSLPGSQTRLRRPQPGASGSQGRVSMRPQAQSTPLEPRTVPRSGGVPRVSSGYGRPSRTSIPCERPVCAQPPKKAKGPPKDEKKAAKDAVAKQEEMKTKRQFELPPLSILLPKKDVYEDLEKLKAKTRRRQAPEGEDTKAIREILKNMVDKEVTVHEFVGLLSPYTADNGTILRTILANELSHFRTMARKVYDTMTQDVSDVLINEHVQLTEASKERHAMYTDKMMRAIDEIYEYVPEFNFEKYYADPVEYLTMMFPLQLEVTVDEETEALQMRQEAYHRLMWLRSEGDRLGEENKRLGDRLKELKRRQKDQMKKAGDIEKQNEDKRKELEKTQEALEEELEVMHSSIEKSIVEQEKAIREEEDVMPQVQKKEKKRVPRKPLKKPPENWNVKAAAQIEESQTAEALVSEVSRVSMASSVTTSKGAAAKPSTGAVPKQAGAGAKKKVQKKKYKFTRPKVEQDADPFHYSPIKTPPAAGAQPRERSPFHYSPPKTPPSAYLREAAGAVPNMQTTRVSATTSSVDQAPQRPAPPRMGRRTTSTPRDSWGGFY